MCGNHDSCIVGHIHAQRIIHACLSGLFQLTMHPSTCIYKWQYLPRVKEYSLSSEIVRLLVHIVHIEFDREYSAFHVHILSASYPMLTSVDDIVSSSLLLDKFKPYWHFSIEEHATHWSAQLRLKSLSSTRESQLQCSITFHLVLLGKRS